jgi:hypothetical protein
MAAKTSVPQQDAFSFVSPDISLFKEQFSEMQQEMTHASEILAKMYQNNRKTLPPNWKGVSWAPRKVDPSTQPDIIPPLSEDACAVLLRNGFDVPLYAFGVVPFDYAVRAFGSSFAKRVIAEDVFFSKMFNDRIAAKRAELGDSLFSQPVGRTQKRFAFMHALGLWENPTPIEESVSDAFSSKATHWQGVDALPADSPVANKTQEDIEHERFMARKVYDRTTVEALHQQTADLAALRDMLADCRLRPQHHKASQCRATLRAYRELSDTNRQYRMTKAMPEEEEAE